MASSTANDQDEFDRQDYVTVLPDSGHHPIGFRNAGVCKSVILGTLAFTFGFKILLSKYHTRLHVCVPCHSVMASVFQLIISSVCLDSVWDVFGHSFLFYCFRSTERQWGSAKFALFLLWTHVVSVFAMATWMTALRGNGGLQCIPGGLFGPLFALASFQSDKYSLEGLVTSSLSSVILSKKFLISITCLQILSVSRLTVAYGSIGIFLGGLYYSNVLGVQSFGVPRSLRFLSSDLLGLKQCDSRATLMGATPEIHDDIIYDYNSRHAQWATNPTMDNPLLNNPVTRRLFNPRGAAARGLSRDPVTYADAAATGGSNEVTQEKVQFLVDMGFPRLAVVQALHMTNSDVQGATDILVAQQTG